MAYSNSSLVNRIGLSPNFTPGRTYDDGVTYTLDTITIHCYVGQATMQSAINTFSKVARQASCHYAVCTDGIAQIVEEKNRSWCTGGSYKNNGQTGRKNDFRACTFEVACDSVAPYKVRDDVYERLINLVADVCIRNGIKKLVWSESKDNRIWHKDGCNMTVHRDYDARSCPGDWLYDHMKDIQDKVNAIISANLKPDTDPQILPAPEPTPAPRKCPYLVKVSSPIPIYQSMDGFNQRATCPIGVYTIVAENRVNCDTVYGKLKSGAGWIDLGKVEVR